jgi:hypothetical protein
LKYKPIIIRGVGKDMEADLGLPDMETAPPYQEQTFIKKTIPGKEGGDNTGIRTNHMKNNTTR